LLAAQSLGIGLKGSWTQVKSSPTLTYYYADLGTLAQDQTFKNLTADGPTAGLVLQVNPKGGHWTLTGEVLYSRLQSKTDSVLIFPPPYS
jgi:hypothetical protein